MRVHAKNVVGQMMGLFFLFVILHIICALHIFKGALIHSPFPHFKV